MADKTHYRYIHFIKKDLELLNQTVYECRNNRTGSLLGTIALWTEQNKWEIQPNRNTGFTVSCLRDIVAFMEQL